MIYVKVSVPILLFKTFIYSYNKSENHLFIGQGVHIQFNNRNVSGFITEISHSTSFTGNIKPILSINYNSVTLSTELLHTINWMSKYYITPIGKILKATIPYQLFETKTKKTKKIKISKLGTDFINKIKFPKQKQILKYLAKSKNYIDLEDLQFISISYREICKKLYEKKLIIIKNVVNETIPDKKELFSRPKIELNKEQSDIYNNFTKRVIKGEKKFILSGIPGSGKTIVYSKIVDSVLKKKKQIIILVPEISLIQQTFNQVDTFFKGQVGIWHSRLSKNEKSDTIKKIKTNKINIMIGVRSCLFIPFNNLGLVIVDEEQEPSYKQTGVSPYYNARDVAIIRSKFSQSIIILCSATLSLESFFNIKNKGFIFYFIKNRYKNFNMPKVNLVDMIKETHKNQIPIISKELKLEIQNTLNKKEQIILLQNRRSYSYIIQCSNCKTTIECKNCRVSLKYHKDENVLQCHHCNYKVGFTSFCSLCKQKSLQLFGSGTQKIEEILSKIFPEAKILRYDRDTVNKKNNYYKILDDFNNYKADILVGTQMIAKGLDFKNVSLTGVINADVGMLLPDFRAGEKVFQLIYQLIGRSGRHKNNSKAIIQSYNVDDQYINLACQNKLNEFYDLALEERKELFYPPFSRIIKIVVKGIDKQLVSKEMKEISKRFSSLQSLILLGPCFCPIEKLNNQFRMHLIIKSKKQDWMKIYKFIINNIGLNTLEKKSKKLSVSIDVDPISFI